APAFAPRPAQRAKHPHIVESEIARVVLVLAEIDAVLGEHVAKGAEVKRLAVGDHAVKIEDDGTDHRKLKGKTFAFKALAGPDRDLQSILSGRVRALVGR